MHELQEMDRRNIETAQRAWRVERIAWTLMAVALLAAGAGLLSEGPLSWSTARQGDVEVRYERFVRRGGPSSLSLTGPVEPSADGTVTVWISGDYLDSIRIEDIRPEPAQEAAGEDGTTFTFDAGSARTVTVRLEFTPDSLWDHVGLLRLGGGEPVRFRQLMYP